MIHQGSGGFRGTPADIQIAAREILEMTRRMAEIISRHSGQDVEQVLRDIDRDRFMSPEEAVEYGLVDASHGASLTSGRADSGGWTTSGCSAPRMHSRWAGRVWLTDPVDAAGIEDRIRALGEPGGVLQLLDRHERDCVRWAARLGVPHCRAWQSVLDAPFVCLPVREQRWWREVALWEPTRRTLVCADALGTVPFFRAPTERIGWHPLVRPFPPRSLSFAVPERILVGHGAGVHDGATEALRDALHERPPAASGGDPQCGQNQLVGGQ